MPRAIIGTRRCALEIVAEVLAVCRNGAVNKTAIMYRGNLSFEQLQRYLYFLYAQHLLEKNEAGQYVITPRGHEILCEIEELVALLRGLQEEGGTIEGNGNGNGYSSAK